MSYNIQLSTVDSFLASSQREKLVIHSSMNRNLILPSEVLVRAIHSCKNLQTRRPRPANRPILNRD